MPSREFTDSVGVQWRVWSVVPSSMSESLTRLSGQTDERRAPWLVFQSAEGEKRRLVPIPAGWEECDEFMLERWTMRAVRVPPAPARRTIDTTTRARDEGSTPD